MFSEKDKDDTNQKKKKESFLISSLNSLKNLFEKSNKK